MKIDTGNPFDSQTLGKVFLLQKGLLDKYIERKVYPNYPLAINNLEHQQVLRGLLDYLIEELAEAFEEYAALCQMVSENKEPAKISEKVKVFNMELSDTFHFLVEILVFTNISEEDVDAFYKKTLTDLQLDDNIYFEDTLQTSIAYGRHIRIFIEGYRQDPMAYKLKPIPTDVMQAGNSISNHNLETLAIISWGVTLCIKKCSNLLKLKEWRKQNIGTNVQDLQNRIMEVWVAMMVYYEYLGLDELGLFAIYEAKNKINLERVKTKW